MSLEETAERVGIAGLRYLQQHQALQQALAAELFALTAWTFQMKKNAHGEAERSARIAWQNARRARESEEAKLRALTGAVDQALGDWDREGPSA